jgi:hypothetical protein
MTILDLKKPSAKTFKLHRPYQELSQPTVPASDRADIFR